MKSKTDLKRLSPIFKFMRDLIWALLFLAIMYPGKSYAETAAQGMQAYKTFTITNNTGAYRTFYYHGLQSWISGSASYYIAPGASHDATVALVSQYLTVGTYNGAVEVSWSDNLQSYSYQVPVTFTVVDNMGLSPAASSFTVAQGLQWNQVLTLTNPGPGIGQLQYVLQDNAAWVSESPDPTSYVVAGASTTSNEQILTSGLALGTYTGKITVTSGTVSKDIPLTLDVVDNMVLTPGSISAAAQQGTMTTQTFTITDPGPGVGALNYQLARNQSWINLSQYSANSVWSGASVDRIAYLYSTGLAVGTYTGKITVTSGTVVKDIPVTLNVVDNMTLSPASLYAAKNASCNPVSKILNIARPSEPPSSGGLLYYISDDKTWMSEDRSSCTLNAGQSCNVNIIFSPADAGNGAQSGTITVTSGTVVKTVPVTFSVNQAPSISGGGGSFSDCSTFTANYTVTPDSECTTSYTFQFWTDPNNLQNAGTGTITGPNPVTLTKTFTGLDADTTYYYRLITTNNTGTTTGETKTIAPASFPRSCSCATSKFCIGNTGNKVCLRSSAGLGSGNLFHDQSLYKDDFKIFYNSTDNYAGALGSGWTHTYNVNITDFNDGSLALMREDGKRVYFDLANGTYSPEARSDEYSWIVKNADGTYTRTSKDGAVHQFNASGKLLSIADRNNNQTVLQYTNGDLTTVTDHNGRTFSLTYDANHHITGFTSPGQQATTLAYDANGLLSTVTDQAGHAWHYTYDSSSRMLTKTDPAGNVVTYVYDTNGKLVQYFEPDGKTKLISYNPSTYTSVVTELNGGVWTYKYDKLLDVKTEVTDPLGNITRYAYDSERNLLSVTAPDNSVTSYTYDTIGNRLSETDALNNTTAYTYNDYSQLTSVTDPLGHVTTYNYDTYGNLVSIVDASGTTQYQHDQKGNITGIINAAGNTTTLAYDTHNNITSITGPDNAVTSMTYDAEGNITARTDPNGSTTTFEYDLLGRLIHSTDPNNKTTALAYDANSNIVSETDANGRVTSFERNSKGQLTRATDALGNVTVYAYGNGCQSCGNDKLSSVTDAQANVTAYTYDLLGRLISETDPSGNITAYSYDSKGNLVSRTDAKGVVTAYAYDALNRLTSRTYPGGITETFTYDVNGNVTSATNQNVSYSMAYDAKGRITSVTDSNNRTISYTYDSLGNRTGMTTPEGKVISYAYDSTSRLTQIQAGAGQAFDFTYDTAGRRTGITYPNGATTAYTYDTLNRLTSLAHTKSGVTIDSFTYTHDDVGNRLTKTDTTGTHSYQYDLTYQLTQASHPSTVSEAFTYDHTGNRITETRGQTTYNYTHASGNRIATRDGESYTYDANGNIISRTNGNGTTTYAYDYENRLVTATMPDVTVTEYKYDPFGRRIEETVTAGGVSSITRNLYDGANILNEYDGNGLLQASYVHNLGIDDPLSIEKNGGIYYYHKDGLGSVTALTDSTGSKVQSYEYDSFGNLLSQTGTLNQPYTYTGREYDPETGLYYYRARYYDSKLGRFISKDPIGFAGGDVNVYNYVRGNAVNWVDPWGLQPAMPVPIGPKAYGGGLGQMTGTIIGRAAGAAVGAYYGTIMGIEVGMTYGASIGLPAGPLGSFAGAIVGGAAGGAIGGVLGGIAGGTAGGFVGHQFDSRCAGLLNCGEDEMLREFYEKQKKAEEPCR